MVLIQESSRSTVGEYTLEAVSGSISPEVAGKIVRLLDKVWPSPGVDFSTMAQGLYDWVREDPSLQLLLVWEEETLVGHARLFQRVIKNGERQIALLGLAGLCSDPDRRGRGIGRTLAERAFEEVQLSHYPICLFQTDKAAFYRKLGAVEVRNTFVNRRDRSNPGGNPWWEPNVMIYPEYRQWPEGEINLNGPAF